MRTFTVTNTYHKNSFPLFLLLCHQKTLMNPQSFHTARSEGSGEGEHFSDLAGVSVQGSREIRALIAFVSPSSFQYCSLEPRGRIHKAVLSQR